MNREEVIALGFVPLSTYTIMNSLTYDLGRHRFLSVGSVGTPNEMVFIYERDPVNPKTILELIPLHNYDYDGQLTEERLKVFMALKSQPKKTHTS